jgi:hypothetical protein
MEEKSGNGTLKMWFHHLYTDTCMTLSVLAVLWIFWEAISLMRFRHYPEDKLSSLEELHFRIMYCALVVLGCNFLIKLVVGLWPKK